MVTPFLLFLVIILIVVRQTRHRGLNHLKAKDYAISGHYFVLLIICGHVEYTVSDDITSTSDQFALLFVWLIMFGIPAFIFYSLSRKWKRRMQQRYFAYQQLVTQQGITNVYQLSGFMNLDVRDVITDLEYMAHAGMIPHSVLEQQHAPFVPNASQGMHTEAQVPPSPASNHHSPGGKQAADAQKASAPKAPVSIRCGGCGAVAVVTPGSSVECEFCGNALTYPG